MVDRAGFRRRCVLRSPQPILPPCRHQLSQRRHKRPPSMQPLQTTALAGNVSSSLSMFDLFLQSDSIVKLVMLILLVASFWSWAVIFDKVLRQIGRAHV